MKEDEWIKKTKIEEQKGEADIRQTKWIQGRPEEIHTKKTVRIKTKKNKQTEEIQKSIEHEDCFTGTLPVTELLVPALTCLRSCSFSMVSGSKTLTFVIESSRCNFTRTSCKQMNKPTGLNKPIRMDEQCISINESNVTGSYQHLFLLSSFPLFPQAEVLQGYITLKRKLA